MHLTLLGEAGLRRLAEINHRKAAAAAERLAQIPGISLVNDAFFNEFTLRLPGEARPAVREMADHGVLGGVSLGRLYPGEDGLANGLVLAVTETATDDDVAALAKALEGVLA
jgi:glycine cleavage system P protein (glycine dehydrogenase) subunit 1